MVVNFITLNYINIANGFISVLFSRSPFWKKKTMVQTSLYLTKNSLCNASEVKKRWDVPKLARIRK